MNIWFGEKKEGRDQIGGENKGDEGGVEVPASEYVLNLRINLLENGDRTSCHCCRGEKCSGGLLFRVSSN